ncbi:MAG: beta strand repeat-containing protein, partial [Cytophagaceae bacterium]
MIRINNPLRAFIVLFLALFFSEAQAATFYSRASGTWNTIGTWSTVGIGGISSGSTPTSLDDVQIGGGFTVTLPASAVTCLSVNLISAPGTLTFATGGTLNVTGAFSSAASTTINMSAGGTLNVGGNLTLAGTFIAGTGTVVLNGAAAQNLSLTALTLNIFSTAGSGTKRNIGGSFTVTSTLTVGTGTTLDLGTTLTSLNATTAVINGTLLFSSVAVKTVVCGSTLSGSGTIDMSTGAGTLAHSLILNGTPNTIGSFVSNIQSNVTYGGTNQSLFVSSNYTNLIINSSGIASLSGSTGTVNGGTLTINTGRTLSAGTNTLTMGGDWINSGTFTAGSGNVIFNGLGIQNITGSSSTTFNSLVIANTSGPVNVSQVIAAAFTNISTGAMLDLGTLSGHNLGAVSGTGTLALSANNAGFTSFPAGNFSSFLAPGGTGTVYYNNTTSYTISGIGSNYYNLQIGGTGVKALSTSITVNNNLLI